MLTHTHTIVQLSWFSSCHCGQGQAHVLKCPLYYFQAVISVNNIKLCKISCQQCRFSHACKRVTYAVGQILLLSEGFCLHSHSRGKAPDTICSFLSHYIFLFLLLSSWSFFTVCRDRLSNRAFHFSLSLAQSVFPFPTSTFYTLLLRDECTTIMEKLKKKHSLRQTLLWLDKALAERLKRL